ncbi:hypothetical protein F4861DRAFT_169433 [Xylaria intraflava]|nr:hypothetical protein F4861DRAFT_169433 [Xylaria intraflava]
MTSAYEVHRPMRSGNKWAAESIFLEVLPLEIRLSIYEFVYADLINELSDNLFAVFSLYDFLYDYTRANLESHVGKTGLTALLLTCKQVHDEAFEILCRETEFVLNLMGDRDGNDEEREEFRFSQDILWFKFAKNLKINLEPLSDVTNERFVNRIHRFVGAIDYGVNLRSLKIWLAGPYLQDPQSVNHILLALSTLRTTGHPIEVYLGQVTEDVLSGERLGTFLDTINGIGMGRDHDALEPDRYDGEGGDDDDY